MEALIRSMTHQNPCHKGLANAFEHPLFLRTSAGFFENVKFTQFMNGFSNMFLTNTLNVGGSCWWPLILQDSDALFSAFVPQLNHAPEQLTSLLTTTDSVGPKTDMTSCGKQPGWVF